MEEQEKKRTYSGLWYQKNWYKDYDQYNALDPLGPGYSVNNQNFDSNKYRAYKKNSQIITALSKEKYGVVLKDNILYLKKVVGGLMIDETGKSLNDQLSIIENLFNS
jgi:hypothetical protein